MRDYTTLSIAKATLDKLHDIRNSAHAPKPRLNQIVDSLVQEAWGRLGKAEQPKPEAIVKTEPPKPKVEVKKQPNIELVDDDPEPEFTTVLPSPEEVKAHDAWRKRQQARKAKQR